MLSLIHCNLLVIFNIKVTPRNIFILTVMYFVRCYFENTKNIYLYYLINYYEPTLCYLRGLWFVRIHARKGMKDMIKIFIKIPKARRMLLLTVLGVYTMQNKSNSTLLRVVNSLLILVIIGTICHSMYIFIHIENRMMKNHPK